MVVIWSIRLTCGNERIFNKLEFFLLFACIIVSLCQIKNNKDEKDFIFCSRYRYDADFLWW
jgi:hypothetical protein